MSQKEIKVKTTCPGCLQNWLGFLEEIIKVNSICRECREEKIDKEEKTDSLVP